jgi:hypothetical protein
MPASVIREWSAEYGSKFGTRCPFGIESLPAVDLIKTMVKRCDVSVLAARVRAPYFEATKRPDFLVSMVLRTR